MQGPIISYRPIEYSVFKPTKIVFYSGTTKFPLEKNVHFQTVSESIFFSIIICYNSPIALSASLS
jgi:hypothetical protein